MFGGRWSIGVSAESAEPRAAAVRARMIDRAVHHVIARAEFSGSASSSVTRLSGRGARVPQTVQNDTDVVFFRRFSLGFLDHQKTLAVACDIVFRYVVQGAHSGRPVEELPGMSHTKCGLRRNLNGHHLGLIAIEELISVAGPHYLLASPGGDLPLRTRAGKRLRIDFRLAGLVGGIG